MPRCNINLAEEIIWPRWKRLMAYRIILVYLLVMAVVLVAVMLRAVGKVSDGIAFYSESRAVQKTFAKQYPGTPDLLDHAQKLKEQLDRNAARIAAIGEALPESVHSVLPALVLLANHSDKSTLQKLAFSQQSPKKPMMLSFDLVVPESAARNGSPSQSFVLKWKKDPILTEHFSELKPVRSRRETLRGKPVYITQYKATNKD
jgi:hypothetical protein